MNGRSIKSKAVESIAETPSLPTLSQLDTGAEIFITSTRIWVNAAKARTCIYQVLADTYIKANCPHGLTVLDELLCLLSTAAIRPVTIHCHHKNLLSPDEVQLMRILQAIEGEQVRVAQFEVTELIKGPLNRTFRRIAEEYVRVLNAAGLSFKNANELRLVH